MFERFTDRARAAVVQAQEEARALGHDEIGTEHILLGVAADTKGVAHQVLISFELSAGGILDLVVEARGRESKKDSSNHLPFTARGRKVFDLAMREALQLGDNYIGTEHILLGLIREGEGIAAHVLVSSGLDLVEVRERICRVSSGQEPRLPTPIEAASDEGPKLEFSTQETELLEKLHERLDASIERHIELLAQSAALTAHLRVMIHEDEKTRDLLRIAIARREQ